MKKTKILLPAIGMLLLSTAASVTGTVAWFAANSTVSATGMQVKAKGEAGIAIANTEGATATYKAEIASAKTETKELLPTSTADFAKWYHNNNANPDSANDAVGTYTPVESENAESYYVKHSFYVRNTSAEAKKGQLKFDTFVATVANPNNADSTSADLNKSLRTGVKITNVESNVETAIFAPLNTTLTEYSVYSTEATAVNNKVKVTTTTAFTTGKQVSLPNNASQGTLVEVFIWFEGEDPNCMSDNLKSVLDNLTISFKITSLNVENVTA